jgi:hypothetical protein
MEFLVILGGFGSEKQSQFIIVRSSAFGGQRQDEGKEFEKTKPIAGLCPEIRSSKL